MKNLFVIFILLFFNTSYHVFSQKSDVISYKYKLALEKSIIEHGDTAAYNKFRKIATYEDIHYSFFMAFTCSYPLAYSDVYTHMMNMYKTVQRTDIDSISLLTAFYMISKGADLNDYTSKQILSNAVLNNFARDEPGDSVVKQKIAYDYFIKTFFIADSTIDVKTFFKKWNVGDSIHMQEIWNVINVNK